MNESDRNAIVPEIDPAIEMNPRDENPYTALISLLNGYEEFTLDPSGIIIGSNLEVVNITGYDPWEVLGKPISIFYPHEDRERGQPEMDLAKAVNEGQCTATGWRLKKKNASFWANIRITRLSNPSGAVTGFTLIIKDKAHKALYAYRMKRLRDEYFNLFNNSYTGIFKFRMEDFRLLLLNNKASHILGVGTNGLVYLHQVFANATAFESFVNHLRSNRRVQGYEFLVYHKGISERWASISCRYFEDGNFVEGVLIDITEKKVQILELERLNHEIDQFIYHASHDLRSPLTSILGLLNLIEMDKPSPTVCQYSNLIRERVNHLDILLKDLISITFNNQAGLKPEKIDFEDDLHSIVKEFRSEYCSVEVYVQVNCSDDFYTEPVRLRTILRSIVSNGFKYHNPHASPPYLNLNVIVQEGKATIVARDNGIGIDEQHLFQVFEMFYRANNKGGGSGLGLYIVKSMVDKLGGAINVKSSRGRGTEFRIELPSRQ